LRERLGLEADEVAFMGDDYADLTVLATAGLAVAPANAHPWINDRVHWRTQARGGEGAARELCDLLLVAQGKVDALLAIGGDR
jgi:3-deoxy-D-manno-octulosonate 8-phosphate phosphatase (KDO 8-P phosphatase)